MSLIPALCVVFISVVSLTTADMDYFQCDGLHPRNGAEVQTGPVPFQIFLSKTGGVETPLKPNEEVRVVIKPTQGGNQTFTRFALQGHYVRGSPKGAWLESSQGLLQTCDSEADTLTNRDVTTKQTITATWRAPSEIEAKVEFWAVVVGDGNRYWSDIHSVLLNREVPLLPVQPGPVMIEDIPEGAEVGGRDQDAPAGEEVAATDSDMTQTKEEKERESEARKEEELEAKWREDRQKKIDSEDAYSEGDWKRQEILEKRRHEEEIHQEEMQYELQKEQETRRRKEQIRLELRDKEEYDRIRAQEMEEERRREKESKLEPARETNVVAAVGSGSGRIVCSLAAILFAAVAMLY